MIRRRQSHEQTARKAAVIVAVCAAVILGASGLMLGLVVWNQPATGESPRFYTELPGVDLRAAAPAKLPELLKRLNAQRCPCECLRTVASCRNHHLSCRESIEAARQALLQSEPPAK